MLSHQIQKAKSILLGSKVEFSTKISHNGIDYFVIVGSESFQIYSQDFKKIQAIIEYKHVERMIISTKNPNLFQLHLSIQRNPNVPAKMNILCESRRLLVQHLCMGWKTDYMYIHLEARELPLYKQDFNVSQNTIRPPPMLFLMEPQESQQMQMQIISGFKFWLPTSFEKSKQIGVFTFTRNKTCKINVQVSEPNYLEMLNHIGDKIDLQYYTETFLESIIHQQQAEKDHIYQQSLMKTKKINKEDEDEDEMQPTETQEIGENEDIEQEEEDEEVSASNHLDYWILQSNKYVKRENLNNDSAEWTGWEVHARIKKWRDIVVIMMRRKYEPPLLENYHEFAITFYGPEGGKTTIMETETKNLNNEESESNNGNIEDGEGQGDGENSGEENKKKDDDVGKQFALAWKSITSGQEFQILTREIADSIQSIQCVTQRYDIQIRMNLNGLLLNEEQMLYCQQKLMYFPKQLTLAYALMEVILDFIITSYKKPATNKLIVKYNGLKEQLRKKYQNEVQDIGIYKTNLKKPLDLISQFESEGPGYGIDIVKDAETRRIWNYKLARYFAFCINGGLLNDFKMSEIIDITKDPVVSGEFRSDLLTFIDYLLYAQPETTSNSDFTTMDLTKRLQKMIGKKYIYNESILESMIENDFFSDMFLKREHQSQLYSGFMNTILLQSRTSTLKIAVCKHLINFLVLNRQGNETIVNAFKQMLGTLCRLLHHPNKRLSTLVIVTLYNLCNNMKEFCFILQKDHNILVHIMEKLKSHNQVELSYSLKLICVLMSIVQNAELFLQHNIATSVLVFLEDIDIEDASYSAQTVISACQIFKICQQNDMIIKDIPKVLNLLYNVFLEKADRFSIPLKDKDLLKGEILSVLSKICISKKELIREVHDALIDTLLGIVTTSNSIPFVTKVVYFLCLSLWHDVNLIKLWAEKEPHLEDAFSAIEQQEIQGGNFLMKNLQPLIKQKKPKT